MIAGDTTTSATCPDCGSVAIDVTGKIPATNAFAGKELDDIMEGGYLNRCRECHLAFRYPSLDKRSLDVLYEGGAEFAWKDSPNVRRDWKIAERWLAKLLPRGASILDVGCFDGGFLNSMGGKYHRYGIEIHTEARVRAEIRGISIVGTDFTALQTLRHKVDCVTAFDVIEHVHSPAKFLMDCCAAVKTGGYVIISTGNYDAWSFRLMGSAYWYATIGEHVSFISPGWCENTIPDLGLVAKKQLKFSHGKPGLKRSVTELLKNVLYRVAPAFFGWLRRRGLGKKDARANRELAMHPPVWSTAKDHFIILLRKGSW